MTLLKPKRPSWGDYAVAVCLIIGFLLAGGALSGYVLRVLNVEF